MKISDREIEAVSKLNAFQRYQYFIKRVADSEKMYILGTEEENFALAKVDNNILFSVWPTPEFALLCNVDQWKNFNVREITLEEFEDHIVDEIGNNNWLINVFSTRNKSGFVVDLDEFARDLNEEMKRYH